MYMELCNIWIFAILPILTAAIIFAVKRKLLWIAPIVSTILAFITYAIVFAPIKAMFANNAVSYTHLTLPTILLV